MGRREWMPVEFIEMYTIKGQLVLYLGLGDRYACHWTSLKCQRAIYCCFWDQVTDNECQWRSFKFTIKGQFTAVFGTRWQIMNASGIHLNVYNQRAISAVFGTRWQIMDVSGGHWNVYNQRAISDVFGTRWQIMNASGGHWDVNNQRAISAVFGTRWQLWMPLDFIGMYTIKGQLVLYLGVGDR